MLRRVILTFGFILLHVLCINANEFNQRIDSTYNLYYSTYLGGSGGLEYCEAVAFGPDGSIHAVGFTESPDFYIVNAYDSVFEGISEVYFMKISPDGDLLFRSFLGGDDYEQGYDIEVDEFGYIYVYGSTFSTDFPTTTGAYDETHNGIDDYFITKFTPDGSSIVFSTFIGGSDREYYYSGITLDAENNVYCTGMTQSSDFPLVNSIYSLNGNSDPFISKLSSDGSTLLFSTCIGGTETNQYFDRGQDIAVDNNGAICIVGITGSGDFPLVNAFDNTYGSTSKDECFITKVEYNSDTFVWDIVFSSFLGGTLEESWPSIGVDLDGNFYVTGTTTSDDFPIYNAYQSTRPGFEAIFITKVSPTGSLVYSTYLGGLSIDGAQGIVVDTGGRAIVCGRSKSTSYPFVNPIDSTNNFDYETIVTMFSPDGQSLEFSTFLGGSGMEHGREIDYHPNGDIAITGQTRSADFPIVNGYENTLSSEADHFIAVLSYKEPGCCQLRGDALHDNQLILVNDLVFLVNYVFKGGPPPECLEEGDALADNGLILVNDLVYLVNYVFKGGPPPPPC